MKIYATSRASVQTGYDTWENQTMIVECSHDDTIASIIERVLAKTCSVNGRCVALANGFHFEVVASEPIEVDTHEVGRVKRVAQALIEMELGHDGAEFSPVDETNSQLLAERLLAAADRR